MRFLPVKAPHLGARPTGSGARLSTNWRGFLRDPAGRAVLAALLVAAASTPARAGKTLKVPQDYFTIQDALNASAPGDVIQLAPGSYAQPLVLKDGVTLEGVAGRDSCRIIPLVNTDYLIQGDSLTAGVTLRGLTIQGKHMVRQGIRVSRSRFILEACRVMECNTGVWLVNCPSGRIEGNDIHDFLNQAICLENSTVDVFGNDFHYVGSYAIAVLGPDSHPLIGGSRAHANHFASYASSVDLGNGTPNPIDARYNDWGQITTIEMNMKGYPANIASIEDHFDDPQNGPVDYRNWKGQPLLSTILTEPKRLVFAILVLLLVVSGVAAGLVRSRRRRAPA